MHLLRNTFITLLCLCVHCFGLEVPYGSQVMDYVENNLAHCGVLKMTETFVYVDVDDAYINTLISLIEKEGFEKPPYFGNPYTEGAHISVMYNDEVAKYKIMNIPECGEVIYFTPKTCKIVHPVTWRAMDEVYLITVDAPELEKIRKKYGLPLNQFEFHITIGVKPKAAA
jgi:hypothetical protein